MSRVWDCRRRCTVTDYNRPSLFVIPVRKTDDQKLSSKFCGVTVKSTPSVTRTKILWFHLVLCDLLNVVLYNSRQRKSHSRLCGGGTPKTTYRCCHCDRFPSQGHLCECHVWATTFTQRLFCFRSVGILYHYFGSPYRPNSAVKSQAWFS